MNNNPAPSFPSDQIPEEAKSQVAGAAQPKPHSKPTSPPPRPIGSLADELIKNPIQDIANQAKSFFDINKILNISPEDDAKTKERKQQAFAKLQQFNQEDQAAIAQRAQELAMKKRQAEQEEMVKQQKQQEEANQQIAAPSSPQRGAPRPGGSKKAQAIGDLQQSMKTGGLNTVQSAG